MIWNNHQYLTLFGLWQLLAGQRIPFYRCLDRLFRLPWLTFQMLKPCRFSVFSHFNHFHNHKADSTTHTPIKPKPSFLITDAKIQSEVAHHDPGVAQINNGSFWHHDCTTMAAHMSLPASHFYHNEL
ncbi:hypothetical protein TIFTF001_013322 [Ficus carica]|uniref:Uncharacterized protein n=1 Tax=Ficus carica TaxID=3494 RepID=A0AA88APR0_FICCA|nr:hypothetical protein TIFTF001_013322 [Ficus carica]